MSPVVVTELTRLFTSSLAFDAGNKYDVSIVDLWSNHAPWPVNQLPKS